MEILLKKGSSGNKTTTTINEIADLLGLTHIMKSLRDSQVLTNKFIKDYKPNKEDVISLVKNDFINKGEVLNITFPASIEKDEKIPVGSIYYNKVTDTVRIKKKNGWTNFA